TLRFSPIVLDFAKRIGLNRISDNRGFPEYDSVETLIFRRRAAGLAGFLIRVSLPKVVEISGGKGLARY
ncbi:MAG: hypothetical protein WA228_03235, partial [Desulfobaccales bacterium]